MVIPTLAGLQATGPVISWRLERQGRYIAS